eukprot:3057067-Rhodomonas_salina.8
MYEVVPGQSAVHPAMHRVADSWTWVRLTVYLRPDFNTPVCVSYVLGFANCDWAWTHDGGAMAVPGETDSFSLLFNAYVVCRVVPVRLRHPSSILLSCCSTVLVISALVSPTGLSLCTSGFYRGLSAPVDLAGVPQF